MLRLLDIRLSALVAAVLLAGCGGTSTPAPAESDTTASSSSKLSRDVDLAVVALTATPRGPTMAETITLSFAVVNRGTDCTPYAQVSGTLSYVPIVWRVLRAGEPVATGAITGLTGGDRVERQVRLSSQPEGDRTYEVVIDEADVSGDAIPENDRAEVTVIYGGSG